MPVVIEKIHPRYFRPSEVDLILGNPAKAKEKMGWEPKVKFDELVRVMTETDWGLLKK